MIRRGLGLVALRAYPRDVARVRGAEMLSMVFDMADTSRLAFARELAFLVICGLRERAHLTAGGGRRQLLTDACRVALILYLTVPLWNQLSGFGMLVTYGGAQWLGVLLADCVAFALLLVGYNRWVGIGGLCAIAIGVTVTVLQGQPSLTDVLNPVVTMAVPALCCARLAIAPGRRSRRFARLWWFALVIVLAIVLPPSPLAGVRFMFGLGYEYAFLAAASAVGVLRLAYDPRLALGCGLASAAVALPIAYSDLAFGFAAAGSSLILRVSALVLTAAMLRLALMRPMRPT